VVLTPNNRWPQDHDNAHDTVALNRKTDGAQKRQYSISEGGHEKATRAAGRRRPLRARRNRLDRQRSRPRHLQLTATVAPFSAAADTGGATCLAHPVDEGNGTNR
jgi:hypothetical protein